MKFLFFAFLFLSSCAHEQASKSYPLSRDVYKKNQKFIAHEGKGRFGRYISMNIAYAPVKELYERVENKEGVSLKNRGEAHITVITPVEFYNVLKQKISIKELINLAKKMGIQSSDFEVECLGEGGKMIKDKLERTIYIVVKSPDLVNYRKKVEKLFLKRGGKSGLFEANNFYPHITVGFTKRDLHESDGVIKNRNSCYAELSVLE